MARRIDDGSIERLAMAACQQLHLAGERMCDQCLEIERAIRIALDGASFDKEGKSAQASN